MASNQMEEIIHADPTKDLFISMLTKDLTLKDAVGDLVDNSLDGARRIREDDNYNGLWVRINIDADSFTIADNCGGIPADLARDYAFRFGRPQDPESVGKMEAAKGIVKRSVGQFGIGMKRAIFKLGREFSVDSTSAESRFAIHENVDQWKDREEWKFKSKRIDSLYPSEERGTTIVVTSLLDDVAEQFKRPNFVTELIEEIELEQLYSISSGLEITINNQRLDPPPIRLIHSGDFQTAYREETYPSGLRVRIYAGISGEEVDQGGWYIFCNRRLILPHDQSPVTGWFTRDSIRIPRYHSQFYRFRGYTFFDADNSQLLPLNTSKTSMDRDSAVFIAARLAMIAMMRPVIDFLNDIHTEDGQYDRGEIAERPLREALESAESESLINLSEIPKEQTGFVAPKLSPVERKKTGRIQYSKPIDEIDRVKAALGVDSFVKVGERTFEYYMEMEVDE